MDSFQEHIDYGNFNELPVWGLFLEEGQPVLAVQPHGMNVGPLVSNSGTLWVWQDPWYRICMYGPGLMLVQAIEQAWVTWQAYDHDLLMDRTVSIFYGQGRVLYMLWLCVGLV